ncbi:GIY-YIG catalytic domain-containing protein [Loa loa]|uniref:GIY-YIG catalytic domain-containing protein n=1 Tax=Loa loa TaxID=7209 RepID=A0A1S0TMD1_LOALO|nr:GIY-YIG catalytic domain-containing protein [Loa loa]EFO16704.2 GIY-YIG catalytic domain-containing protein [Loa loa]
MSADESDVICIEDEENIEGNGVKDFNNGPVCQKSFSKNVCGSFSPEIADSKKNDGGTNGCEQFRISLSQLPNSSDKVVQEKEQKKRDKAHRVPSILDEFFGVYCLLSRSSNRYFKNRCYIGYTVNPNRRIRQHNAGKEFGGAKKTDHRGPWYGYGMHHTWFSKQCVCITIRMGLAKSREVEKATTFEFKKKTNETAFEFRLRIACHMLNSDPWRRLSLTFRWLLPELEIPFPLDVLPPSHIAVEHGAVTKISTVIPQLREEYDVIGICSLCLKSINSISELLRCSATEICKSHFHMRCLSKYALNADDEYKNLVVSYSRAVSQM